MEYGKHDNKWERKRQKMEGFLFLVVYQDSHYSFLFVKAGRKGYY